ncbi:class I SAM-dependent methyltransferase [Paraburkholderia acidipaludis]|uniref:class I SAM-dependent methyltransferase n=1 Tax=Paraburkholderia acidipaludis TaxID=660537 RepID=UPI000A794107|nr:class I SAM-dependent methyltransferase [Paraburkholderia acidipaludis]
MTTCWCGSTQFLPFSPEYAECSDCGTLISLAGKSADELSVDDDETDFYGKAYWLSHQSDDLGYPDIHKRARVDLTERNLHWLKTLLKYRLPGAKVMELGCSHGSFVALMRHAGYDASGVEMSPWVVDFGKQTFNVPIFVGPIENLDIPHGSLDVIALMDVMEHLPDPVATLAHCLKLLSPNGMLLIQTPQFRREMTYAELVKANGAFLEQLKSDEHLYLFTKDSASRLFRQIGAEYVQFEAAIFSQYDMFFAVSRVPFETYSQEDINAALCSVPNGRITLALLDLRERELASEADRIARGEQIETLTRITKESEADRAARWEQIEALTEMIKESEADRVVRGERIERLTGMMNESVASQASLGEQVRHLTDELQNTESDRKEQVAMLNNKLEKINAERAASEEQVSLVRKELRVLFGHRLFRLIAKLAGWREAKKLEDKINQP